MWPGSGKLWGPGYDYDPLLLCWRSALALHDHLLAYWRQPIKPWWVSSSGLALHGNRESLCLEPHWIQTPEPAYLHIWWYGTRGRSIQPQIAIAWLLQIFSTPPIPICFFIAQHMDDKTFSTAEQCLIHIVYCGVYRGVEQSFVLAYGNSDGLFNLWWGTAMAAVDMWGDLWSHEY
jgi:hypothetical protein